MNHFQSIVTVVDSERWCAFLGYQLKTNIWQESIQLYQ